MEQWEQCRVEERASIKLCATFNLPLKRKRLVGHNRLTSVKWLKKNLQQAELIISWKQTERLQVEETELYISMLCQYFKYIEKENKTSPRIIQHI